MSFNFDVDLVWDPPIGPEALAKDLEDFPRDELPTWLRETLTGEKAPARTGVDAEEQGRYARRIGNQLVQTLPPGWDYAQVHFREIGGHAETNALVHNVAGELERWSPPRAVTDRFRELRAATRADGPWYSAKFELRATGEQKLEMNRTDEPTWIAPPPPEAYREELRLSGGAEDVLPDWLRAKLV